MARWDERKRWQHAVEKQKEKLKEKAVEVEKLNTTIRSLRDAVSRLEREKIVLDNRLRASRSGRMLLEHVLAMKGSWFLLFCCQGCDEQNM